MLGGLHDRPLEFGSPGITALLRTRVDEIERITVKNRTGDCDSIKGLLGAMQTAEFLERSVVEGLYAEGDAIDARCSETTKTICFHAGRIGFKRHLDIRRDTPVLSDAIQDRLHRRRLHQ